jgi:putative DNA primase/helicase
MTGTNFQAARPTALKPRLESIPHELKGISNWVLWKYEPPKKPDGKWQKVPYQPNGYKASTTNRHTWSTFETCRAVYEQGGYDGVGFVFDGKVGPDGTCLVGIDLDRCIDKRKIQHFALERIKRLGTYTELSVSSTGLHLIAAARNRWRV